ncbi:DUF1330 domain-containing protein [Sulfitobacter sp. JBTF-M27]|uniref:DUF1330 domain-containing protein n=1 Tax=Sulfitobacter sediminilitoris TaxID=2698830 RepID=A0A6P0C5L9_9RHOB|nr:DUF1330 domain-containing protein [Sulfitobacter sediminilitoris]NEK21402.1 DUF1330 domain-containing protein [Sulfitobacter sediminilitoris]
MPKAYIIAHIDVHNADLFAKFRELSAPVLAEYGAKVLVGNPSPDQREGAVKPTTVIVEFKDMETATTFYESQGYTEARAVRQQAADTDLIIVEGLG